MARFERTIEKRMDTFTDDFAPPGASDAQRGRDYSKPRRPFEAPHDDYAAVNENRIKITNEMAAVGPAKEQGPMDILDEIEQRIQAPIKNPYNQFPAETGDKQIVSEVGAFDDHQTDPARLNKMAGLDSSEYSVKISKLPDGWYAEVVNKQTGKYVDHTDTMISKEAAKNAAQRIIDERVKKGLNHMAEEKKIDGPESFHEAVEKKMKQLKITDHPKEVKQEPATQSDPKSEIHADFDLGKKK